MSSVLFCPSPGNHDFGPTLEPYLSIHAAPTENVPAADRGRYYSYDWGNVHFVSLEVMSTLNKAVFAGGSMLRWLDNDLRSTRQYWKVVYFHQPPWSTGLNENDPQALDARQYVCPILEKNGVQIVIGGHTQNYPPRHPQRKGNKYQPHQEAT